MTTDGKIDNRFSDPAFVSQGEAPAYVFRIEASKVMAFAKAPHAQTTFRFQQ